MFSSQHQSGIVDGNQKPETANFYNDKKAGVDTLDQLVRFYTSKRRSKRWIVLLFYSMLDIATYNAYVLYSLKYPEFISQYKTRSKRQFIKLLVEETRSKFNVTEESQPPVQSGPKERLLLHLSKR